MPPSLQAVLFDFDGTLAYYDPPHLALYVRAAAEYGMATTEAALRTTIDLGWERWRTPLGDDHRVGSKDEASYLALRGNLHRARLEAVGLTGNLDAVAARICELEADPVYFSLYEDTLSGLRRVKAAGLRVVIVSNHNWRLPEIVEGLGLALGPHVDVVLTSARVGYRKPHPEIYRAAIEAAGCEADRALFVGDSVEADVAGPRRAGMRAVLLDRAGRGGDLEAVRSLLDVPLL